jgi:hypothetical protein
MHICVNTNIYIYIYKQMDNQFAKKKLITPEDPTHVHKLLGIFCLGNFIYRWGCYLLYRDMFLSTNFGLISLCAHGLLSISSLIFHIPQKRHQGKPMIYPEFRAHSIAFGTRHVLSCIMFWFGYDEPLPHYALCFATMIAADKISTRFTETNKQTTMRNMPLDDTIDEATQQANKLQQSTNQLYATMISCYTINSSFMPLMAIQCAAFMMTLVRKNLISSLTWHRVYNVMLWICIPFCIDPGVRFHMWISSTISYQIYTRVFFKYRTNKYMNWMCVFAIHELVRYIVTYDWGGWCQRIVGLVFTVYAVGRKTYKIKSIMW